VTFKNHSLLYDDSPFLPKIDSVPINSITFNILIARINSAVAISHAIVNNGVTQNELHQQNADWIIETFKIKPLGLSMFLFGYTTPPTLIVGAHLLEKTDTKTVIKTICAESPDELIQNHNTYKARLLYQAHHLFNTSRDHDPVKSAEPIYKLCNFEIFSDDPLYLAGLEASQHNFELCAKLLGYPLTQTLA